MANKLMAWVMTHKPQAALAGGAVGVTGVVLIRKHRASATAAMDTAGVPADATTAASVVPYGGDSSGAMLPGGGSTAGGVPYDPSGFNTDAATQLASLSQQISDLQTAQSGEFDALAALAGLIGSQPTAGGTMTAAPPAVKPKPKPRRHHPVATHEPAKPKPKPKRRRGVYRAPAHTKVAKKNTAHRPKTSKRTAAEMRRMRGRRA